MIDEYTHQQKQTVQELERSLTQGITKSTIFDLQQDYIHDPEICLTSVSFLPQILAQRINEEIIRPLREIEPQHHFYPLDSMHTTIKNIRLKHDPPLFTPSDVEKVDKLFQEIIPSFPTFDFVLEDVLALPTSAALMGYSDQTLQKLVLALDEGLKSIGVPDDKKYFSDSIFWSNVTFCRFVERPGERFLAALRQMRNIVIGTSRVEKIHLITCNFTCSSNSKKIIGEYSLRT